MRDVTVTCFLFCLQSPEDATIKKRLTLSREAMSGFYFRQVIYMHHTPLDHSLYNIMSTEAHVHESSSLLVVSDC